MRWLGERRPILAVDSETTGLSLAKDRIRLVQFGDGMHGWAIPYEEWKGLIRHVLKVYEGKIALQHAKFDAGFLQREGLPFPWERTHDTMIMSFLADSMGPKSLKPAAARYVDSRAQAGEQELKKAMVRNRWTYATIPIEFPPYWTYSALDVVLTARLAEFLWPRIQPYREAYDLELACERVLCDMEMRGVQIDVNYCIEKRGFLQEEWEKASAALGDMNPNATRDVVAALEATGVVLTKRTESGQKAVDDEVLSALATTGNPIAINVLKARTYTKLLGTYFDNFLSFHNDGILNPHINQLAARTGRMSVTEPALQTVPRKSLVRDAFIPREGNRLVLVDYDNQELRVAAHFSQDERMLELFREGRNLHMETARRLYGTSSCDHANKCSHYSTAKNAMFSKAYGAGIDKFSRTAGIPHLEASKVFATLDELYPGLNRTMAAVTAAVRTRINSDGYGYVQLIDGRHLKVRGDKAYVGFNALIQGSCAVVLKRALVDLDAAGLGSFLALPIHDEIMFDVPIGELDEAIPAITEVMTQEDFTIPLTVDSNIVNRWGDTYRGK